MDPRFAHIDSWIFDLDNTLYPASADLFALIDVRMGEYIAELLGCRPDDPRVRRSVTSVQLQCLAAIDRRLPLHSVPTTPAAIADLADHIARFSIGGITGLRAPAPRRSPTRPGTRRAPRARPARRPLRP